MPSMTGEIVRIPGAFEHRATHDFGPSHGIDLAIGNVLLSDTCPDSTTVTCREQAYPQENRCMRMLFAVAAVSARTDWTGDQTSG